jgi:hypothetical protein
MMFRAETEQEALESAQPHIQFFVQQNVGLISQWKGSTTRAYDYYEKWQRSRTPASCLHCRRSTRETSGSQRGRRSPWWSGPGWAPLCRELRDMHRVRPEARRRRDRLNDPSLQFGTLTNEQITKSIQLFTDQVMPKFTTNAHSGDRASR